MRPASLLAVAAVTLLALVLVVRSRRTDSGDYSRLPPPWGDRPAIFAHVRAHLSPTGAGLTEGGDRLPDEDRVVGEGGLRWAPGALDGVMGHLAAGGDASAADLGNAVVEVTRAPSGPALKRCYALLADDSSLARVDALMESLAARKDLDPTRLRSFARWLVTNAPDRGPVKLGLALLGMFRGDVDQELFLTLGRHDEFTLYSAVALQNSLRDPEPAVFALAKAVHGWGRVQAVERLRKTTDAQVKRWLVREGYENSIMYEYLAHLCATTGGLLAELEAPEVDDALFKGAGDILRALVTGQGGPAEGMDDYADGAAATLHYVRHFRRRAGGATLGHMMCLSRLVRFVDEPKADWSARAGRGWTPEVREELRAEGKSLLANPRWRLLVDSGLAAQDASSFYTATAAAQELGIDTWERQLERLRANGAGGSWFEVSRTTRRERMERVVALAEQLLPLDRIATGPGKEMGLGKEWQAHGDLDSILQELGRFPGLGWNLIGAGLNSPVVRNRYMALRALSEWEKARWPAEAGAALSAARAREPDEKVRARMDRLLPPPGAGSKPPP
jgi:hypothetical protein